jgi:phosphohistidine swiveling domain-containing protein
MTGAIKILTDYANGKGFDIIDGGTACLNAMSIHDFCKQVGNIHNLAIKESRQDIIDVCTKTKADMKEVLKDISDLSKSYGGTKEVEKILGDLPIEKMMSVLKSKAGRDDAHYLATNLYDTDKSAMAFIGLHEREKLLAQIIGEAERAGMTEVVEIAKKLDSVFDDMYKIINGKIKIDDDTLLKKYSQNISKCIKTNDMILTLDNGVTDKSLIGNKGANLVEMHKLGINVPQSLFLTTIACKSIHEQQSISFMPLLSKILYMFDTDLIAIRSSGVVSMAGMMDTVLNVDRKDEKAVTEAIMNVVNSWDSDKAKSFRKVCKIDDEIKVSIVIQGMVRGDIGCSGIVFSRNPNNGKPELTGEYVDKSFGDKLAHGSVTPKNINDLNGLKADIKDDLIKTADILERYFREVQDIEFVNDGQQTYFVQTRNAQLTPLARIRTLIDLFNDGYISLSYFKDKYNPEVHKKVIGFDVFGGGGHLLRGTPAVNGIFTGIATFKRETADKNNILIVDSTSPEDMPYLNKIGALVTKIGGMTSHPAVVCRQLSKPCIVGVSSLNFNKSVYYLSVHFNQGQGEKEICEGDEITIIGDTGDIFKGKCEVKSKQLFVGEVNKILNSNG